MPTNIPPKLEELLRIYEENWLSDGYTTVEEESQYKEYGKDILTRFHQIHATDFRPPVAMEHGFLMDIEGIKLRGFIDRVDKLDSGGLSVIDYKSNQELFTAEYVENDLQLTIYQMAAEQTWKLPVEKLTLYHLRSNTPCSCPPRDRDRIDATRRLVLDVAENINRGEFPATEHRYCPCDFAEHCPNYRHKYIVQEKHEDTQPPLPGLAAAEAVERYAALQTQIKDLQTDLDEVRQTIIDYCQAEGLNRVYGSENEISYKITEKNGYNEDEIKAVLGPAGLWEKVLGFDQALLKKLITDKVLPADIVKKLASLKKVISSYPQLWLRKSSGEEE